VEAAQVAARSIPQWRSSDAEQPGHRDGVKANSE